MPEIPNHALQLGDIPPPEAPVSTLLDFALTFDGYRHCGSLGACAEIAQADRPKSLSELRATLFFHQRTAHHMSAWTDYEERHEELARLVGAIWDKVANGEFA